MDKYCKILKNKMQQNAKLFIGSSMQVQFIFIYFIKLNMSF